MTIRVISFRLKFWMHRSGSMCRARLSIRSRLRGIREIRTQMARTLSLEKILKILRRQMPMLAEHYSVETLEVFGSYVCSEQKKDSDLDILVTFKQAPSSLTFIAIENYLSDLLGV